MTDNFSTPNNAAADLDRTFNIGAVEKTATMLNKIDRAKWAPLGLEEELPDRGGYLDSDDKKLNPIREWLYETGHFMCMIGSEVASRPIGIVELTTIVMPGTVDEMEQQHRSLAETPGFAELWARNSQVSVRDGVLGVLACTMGCHLAEHSPIFDLDLLPEGEGEVVVDAGSNADFMLQAMTLKGWDYTAQDLQRVLPEVLQYLEHRYGPFGDDEEPGSETSSEGPLGKSPSGIRRRRPGSYTGDSGLPEDTTF